MRCGRCTQAGPGLPTRPLHAKGWCNWSVAWRTRPPLPAAPLPALPTVCWGAIEGDVVGPI
eukprot:10539281-Lingulodinium_polyedra.AAC.1